MKPVIPTIFAHNKKEFSQRFKKLIKVSKNLQIDFMDGKFVNTSSMFINAVPNLKKYPNNFEAHLMVKNPEKYLIKLKQKDFKKIIFHIEATKNPKKVIEKIKKNKQEPWLAINPDTKIQELFPYLEKVKGVLFLGINPGKEHQTFMPKVYNKIKSLKKKNKKIKIQVDGGINPETAKKVAKLGVDYINSGSFISNSKNPKQAFNNLNHLFKKCQP